MVCLLLDTVCLLLDIVRLLLDIVCVLLHMVSLVLTFLLFVLLVVIVLPYTLFPLCFFVQHRECQLKGFYVLFFLHICLVLATSNIAF